MRRSAMWLGVLLAAALAGAAAVGSTAAPAGAQADAKAIAVDGESPGRVFDGVGALSAGASSRLLIDYPEPHRSRILDYLFKPGYGAALQNLNVEIGGDTNSTDGSEPSHMRTPDDLDCDRGYEWWLMEEAVARNPDVILGARIWGAPSWVGDGRQTAWTDQNIAYHLAWLDCAKRRGLEIDYLGGWNETGFDTDWYVKFDRALEEAGHGDIRIVAADDLNWNVANALADDPAFRDAVDIVGVHYVCGRPFSKYANCPSTATAQSLDKPLWASEQGSQPHDQGAAPLARAMNRQYVDGKMTATVNWALSASWYTSLSFAGAGLMRAYQPWSGYYEPSASIWALAHTTQFTQPGWRYLDSASGRLDGGSYVTLRAPATDDYTMVVETLDATEPQTLDVSVGGGLSTGTAHVWSSDLESSELGDWFVRGADVSPADGRYTLELEPGRVYTISTTAGQGKGTAGPPPDRPFPMPYREGFDSTPAGRSPRFLSDINGAFEAQRCPAGRAGRCLRQVITTQPVRWPFGSVTPPMTLAGDPNWWGDYAVSADAHLEDADHVELLGRIDGQRQVGGAAAGYHLRLASDGRWMLYSQDWGSRDTILASGRLADFDRGAWHRLSLAFRGTRIEVTIDGDTVATVADARHDRGQVGVLASAWDVASFDDLHVRASGPSPRFLSNEAMKATATSAAFGYEAANAIDDDAGSLWHNQFAPPTALPQSITLDLAGRHDVRTLAYQPRYDQVANGVITGYEVHASADGDRFGKVAEGTWRNDGTTKTASFEARGVRFIRLVATAGGGNLASAAELAVSEDAYRLPAPYTADAVVDVRAPEVLGADRTAKVDVTFENRGDEAVENVELDLAAPDGWVVRPTSGTAFASVAPGRSVTTTWEVTPTDAALSATLRAEAHFDHHGRLGTGGNATVQVRRPPTGNPYLSDLEWFRAGNGFGPPERDMSNGERPGGDGLPLTIGGTTYAKGLGVHATSRIAYYLGGNCSQVTARVGVDDEVGDRGSVVFEVWADGRRVYQSPVVTGSQSALPIAADVSGAEIVELVVENGGDGGLFDHGDWADARVQCRDS